jgi:hypothetical protein
MLVVKKMLHIRQKIAHVQDKQIKKCPIKGWLSTLEDAKALRPILYFEKITEVTHLFLRA